jgi:O-antigen/teichoic acid export membrane protein
MDCMENDSGFLGSRALRIVGASGVAGLLKDSVIYGMGNSAHVMLNVILLPLLTRMFSPHDYGIIELINTTMVILAVVVGFRIDGGMSRYFYERRREAASTSLYSLLAVSAAITIVLLLAAEPLQRIIRITPDHVGTLRVALLTVPLQVMTAHFLMVLRLERRAVATSAILVCKTLVTLVGCFVFLVWLRTGIVGLFLARIVGEVVGSTIGLAVLRQFYIPFFSMDLLKKYMVFSLAVPASIMSVFMSHIDRYFLAYYWTAAVVGFFGVGLRISMVVWLIIHSFHQAWLPFATSIMTQENAPAIYTKLTRAFVATALLLSLCLVLFVEPIINVVARPEYAVAAPVVGLLLAGHVVLGMGQLMGIGLFIREKPHYGNISSSIGLVATIGLNVLLVPRYGLMGAAWAYFLSRLIRASITWIMAVRFYPARYPIANLYGMIFLFVGAVVALQQVSLGLPGKLTLLGAAAVAVALVEMKHLKELVLQTSAQPVPGRIQ